MQHLVEEGQRVQLAKSSLGEGGVLEKDEDHLYKWNKMKLLQQLNLKKKNLDKNQQEPTCTEQSGLKSW